MSSADARPRSATVGRRHASRCRYQKTTRPAAPDGDQQDAELDLDRADRVRAAGAAGHQPRAPACSSRHLQRVADAVHGADQVGAELAAQRLDVAVDGAGARRRRPSPRPRRAAAPGAAPSRGRPARQTSRSNSVGVRCASAPARRTRRCGRVDLQVAEADRRRVRPGRLGGPLHPAQQRVHPGGQLPHARTAWSGSRRRRPPSPTSRSVSSSRAVSIRTGTGRSAWIRRQTSRPSKPGQHHVEHDQVRPAAAGRRRPRPGRRPAMLDREALGPQPGGDRLGDGRARPRRRGPVSRLPCLVARARRMTGRVTAEQRIGY